MTKIEWTKSADGTAGKTWNPIVGCFRVSAGCENCYAERVAHRGMQPAHAGLTAKGEHGPRWTGEVRLLPERLEIPLGWKKARRIFVCSMSDLFHKDVPLEFIAAVFGVMAACRQHTFLVLTKRPERAREWFGWAAAMGVDRAWYRCIVEAVKVVEHDGMPPDGWPRWPLRNVHLGVSVENQATADERIPILLELPAAVRWVSYEPALKPVDFYRFLFRDYPRQPDREHLDWIVVGGMSGPGARPFDLAWARSTIAQCKAAGIACFVKQIGANPFEQIGATQPTAPIPVKLRSSKGADPSEWPADLRVREFPT